MKQLLLAALLLSACATTQLAHAACPPAGYDRARLEALKANQWTIANDRERNALARAMTDCLASPDPEFRDGLAYEGLNHWVRGQQLSNETLLALADNLQARLSAPEGGGFERPFAALVLSDVARADRVRPYLSAARRAALLDASIAYFTGVRDYRGFDDAEGWRHGVAHGGDLMLQLALNPAFGKAELTRIRDAIATQISPANHFYIYGEGQRLALPILYIAQRNVFTEAEWTAWLGQVASPAPLASWGDAFSHNSDLARVNNVNAFIQSLYLNARLDQNTDDDALLPGAEAALRALP
jgi:Ni/Co efflux regulator RcnB